MSDILIYSFLVILYFSIWFWWRQLGQAEAWRLLLVGADMVNTLAQGELPTFQLWGGHSTNVLFLAVRVKRTVQDFFCLIFNAFFKEVKSPVAFFFPSFYCLQKVRIFFFFQLIIPIVQANFLFLSFFLRHIEC